MGKLATERPRKQPHTEDRKSPEKAGEGKRAELAHGNWKTTLKTHNAKYLLSKNVCIFFFLAAWLVSFLKAENETKHTETKR